ncbi:hypothetical protein HDU93_002600, partial [Gonapodya sp. JEL0774]
MQRQGIRYQKLPSAVIDDPAVRAAQPTQPSAGAAGRPGAKRTSKISQKLTLFPAEHEGEEQEYPASQPRNRLETERALKALDKKTLPRVHSACIGTSIDLQAAVKRWEGKYVTKRFDEVLYVTFSKDVTNGEVSEAKVGADSVLVSIPSGDVDEGDFGRVATGLSFKEIFVFEYGVVVMWGWSKEEEENIINSLRNCTEDAIDDADDRETE